MERSHRGAVASPLLNEKGCTGASHGGGLGDPKIAIPSHLVRGSMPSYCSDSWAIPDPGSKTPS